MFRPLISRTMEVYIDDLFAKSLKAKDHVYDLRGTFNILKKYNIKLNPEKCSFGVSSGKFLGSMVTKRGIKFNLEKIQAIV